MTTTSPDRAASLAVSLRRLGERVSAFARDEGRAGELAREALDRLERDLLPRTAGGAAHLVAGIVGPNNAGKSALFNALAGAVLSPSRPTGGATRRLVGAARADLLARLVADPALSRFPLRTVDPGPDGVLEATADASDAAELLLVVAESLPPDILLVDTPDFDSVRTGNRLASEALLRVADLALVTVTRHTYQNREVVEFLEAWLSHGRPWLLVYNESISPEVTREHADKLAGDVGVPPLAIFHAGFDLGVAEGDRALRPRALGSRPGVDSAGADEAGVDARLAPAEGTPLAGWLAELSGAGDLKARALRASLGELRDGIASLVAQLDEEATQARALQERVDSGARTLARRVARETMPLEPFLAAFRAVLDRRPTLLQRGLRSALRGARTGLTAVVARVRGHGVAAPERDERLADRERAVLAAGWTPFFEELARDLDPRARPESVAPGSGLRAALLADLAPARLGPSLRAAQGELGADEVVLQEFRAACERLIEAELDASGSEWFLQLGVDALHLFPAVAAGVVILKTGGLGADVAVGGAGALSSILAERLSRVLGSHVAQAARGRWADLRGERLAQSIHAAALPTAGPVLRLRAGERAEHARELARATKEVTWNPANEPRS